MTKQILLAATLWCFTATPLLAQRNARLADLRVPKDKAERMRERHDRDKQLFKISRDDLLGLIDLANAQPAANDTFVFYLVKYTGDRDERRRYRERQRLDPDGDNDFDQIVRKGTTSVLVGFLPGSQTAGHLFPAKLPAGRIRGVYDLAVLCPPPPGCDCEIEQ